MGNAECCGATTLRQAFACSHAHQLCPIGCVCVCVTRAGGRSNQGATLRASTLEQFPEKRLMRRLPPLSLAASMPEHSRWEECYPAAHLPTQVRSQVSEWNLIACQRALPSPRLSRSLLVTAQPHLFRVQIKCWRSRVPGAGAARGVNRIQQWGKNKASQSTQSIWAAHTEAACGGGGAPLPLQLRLQLLLPPKKPISLWNRHLLQALSSVKNCT